MANKSADLPSCREARSLLTAYVERELDNATASCVRAHLAHCEACCEEERRNREALGFLASVPRITAPETMRIEVMALVRAEDRRRQARRPLRWAAVAACLLLVVGASAVVVQRGIRHTNRPESPGATKPVSAAGELPVAAHQTPVATSPKPKAPEPDVEPARPEPRRTASRATSSPLSFLDVKAKDGYSARDKLSMRRRPAVDDPFGTQLIGQGVPVPGAGGANSGEFTPREAVEYTQPYSERLEVGGSSSVVRTEAGYDRQGNIAVIRIRVEKDDTDRTEKPDDPRK